MKRKKRSATVLGIVFLCIGATLLLASLILSNFNLSAVSSLQFSDVTHEVTLPFESIRIDEIDCNVILVPTQESTCRVISQEARQLFNLVSVEDGTLTVYRRDERAWHERALVFGAADPTLTVYLPAKKYDELTVRTTSGSILTNASLSFRTVNLKSVSGDVTLSADVAEKATVISTSGSITAQDLQPASLTAASTNGSISLHRVRADLLDVKTASGALRLDDAIQAKTLEIETVSGNVLLTDVTVTEKLHVTGVSGNVAIFDSEFSSAYVETSSGNVTGTLRSEKQFDVQTTSGVILHPASGKGGTLEIRTVSGNVSFSYLSE